MKALRGRVVERRAVVRLGIRLMRLVSMIFDFVPGTSLIGSGVSLQCGVAMGVLVYVWNWESEARSWGFYKIDECGVVVNDGYDGG